MIILDTLVKKEDELVVSLNFLNKFVSTNLPEIFLFLKLRLFAAKMGGSIKGFKFSKNEKYNVLPNLIKLGWVHPTEERVVKFRNILKAEGIEDRASFNVDKYILLKLKTFKAYILAINEKYLLNAKDFKNRALERSKFKKGYKAPNCFAKLRGSALAMFKTERTKVNDVVSVKGRVFNSELNRLMGVSIPTISRWRKESSDEGFNTYDMKNVVLNPNSLGSKNYLKPYLDRIEKKAFFSPKCDRKRMITKDLVITSDLEVFYIKERKDKGSYLKNLKALI